MCQEEMKQSAVHLGLLPVLCQHGVFRLHTVSQSARLEHCAVCVWLRTEAGPRSSGGWTQSLNEQGRLRTADALLETEGTVKLGTE